MSVRGLIQFPTVYAGVPTPVLLDAFRQGPARLREAVAGLALEQLRARPRGPDRWSILEIVVHAADSELIGAGRIRLVWAQPGQQLPGYDQAIWASKLEYQKGGGVEVERALALLSALRVSTSPIFEAADSESDGWSRAGKHPEYGPVTMRNLLELYADHTERHLAQILESRDLLGQPLEMQLLLPDRLY